MKNQDMNDQQAFDIIIKLVSQRASSLIVTGESIREYVANDLVYEQLVKEARELNDMLEYLMKRLNVHMTNENTKD